MSSFDRRSTRAIRQLVQAERANAGPWRLRARSLSHGFTSDLWSLYGLDDRDPADYLSNYDRATKTRYFNSMSCARTLTNKLVAQHHFHNTLGRDAVPPMVGVWHRDRLLATTPDGGLDEAPRGLRAPAACIAKPVYGDKGRNVVALDEGKPIELPTGETYLVQRRLENAAELHEIWSGSLNTLRIIVANLPGGTPTVIGIAQRFGSATSGSADLFGRAGVSAEVHLEHQALAHARTYRDGALQLVDTHPDSGRRITGVELPGLSDAVGLALRAQRALPGANWVGWDVAIARHGPVLLEGNNTPETRAIEVHGGIFENPLARAMFDELTRVHRL